MQILNIGQFACSDDMATFRTAANYLREHPNTELVLENKTYHLCDNEAVNLQMEVMQGKYGKNPEPHMFHHRFQYVIGIDLNGAKNIVIDGNGAKLIFDGFMENISCQFCENVTIKNLTLDLKRKGYSKGTVLNTGEIEEKGPFIDADFQDAPLLNVNSPTLRIILYSKKTGYFESVVFENSMIHLGGGKYRFYVDKKCQGDEVYLTHTYHYRPSILIYESKNTKLTNVTIHNQGGMGVVGHRSHDIFLEKLQVKPSKDDAMSTNTDATHFTSCTGTLRFNHCYFEGHGDDAANIHTYYHTIKSINGNKCVLKVEAPTGTHSQKLDYFNVGDTIELCKLYNLTPVDTFQVIKATPIFESFCQEVELNKPIPQECVGDLLSDITQLPRLEFLNSTVFNHIARAVLVKTRNVLIEGNTFDAKSFVGIHVAAEAGWREGIASQDVFIKNNKIMHYKTGICIGISAENPTLPVHKNIVIEGNHIHTEGDAYGINLKKQYNFIKQK